MVGIKDFDMPSCCNSCNHWSFNRDDEPLCDLTYEYIRQFDKRQDDCPLVETYTKADMMAMLEELKSEFEQYEPKWVENDEQAVASCRTWEDFDDIIQLKINALKGDSRWQ